MPVFALSIHADYKCQQSGICCTSDWDVPVEVPLYRTLTDAIATGQLSPAAIAEEGYPTFLLEPDLPDEAAAMVGRTSSGNCVFFHSRSGLCVIHRDLGEPQLPSTCRHFPRLAVRDWRGTFISLTHYCPTAAGMLFRDDVPLEIVESPAAFPPAEYEGLTVHPDAWPPLLHPKMLMDLEGYSAWERHMVARCALDLSPESVIGTLARDARVLRSYRPGNESLATAVQHLPAEPVETPGELSLDASLLLHAEDHEGCPGRCAARAGRCGTAGSVHAARRAGMGGLARPAAQVPRRQGVCELDGLPGAGRAVDRARSRSGAGVRADRSGPRMPERRSAARWRRC